MALHFDHADAPSAKLKTSFQTLSSAAQTLNKASDELGAAIAGLDEALNKLNPGLTTWIEISRSKPTDDAPFEQVERLGYSKLNGRWGLCVCVVAVDENDEETSPEFWLLNDAPRKLRLKAIEQVPSLITALAAEASRAADEVSAQAEFALQLVRTVNAISAAKGNRQ